MHARKEHLPEEIIRIKNYIQKHAFSNNIDFIAESDSFVVKLNTKDTHPRLVKADVTNIVAYSPLGLICDSNNSVPINASQLPREFFNLYPNHWWHFRDYWDLEIYKEKGSLSKCMIWLMSESKYKLYRKLGKIKFENGR